MKSVFAIIFSLCTLCAVAVSPCELPDTLQATYKLHGQTRRFKWHFSEEADGGISLHWSIVRNLKLWTGSYTMPAQAVKSGSALSYLMPEDGNHTMLSSTETFGLISAKAYDELKTSGSTTINGFVFTKAGAEEHSPLGPVIVAENSAEGACMWILDCPTLPLIVKMADNPLEINWTVSGI